MLDLAELPAPALRAWFAALTTFLLDCDGVLWRASEPVPGVGASLAALRAAGKRVFFVTNNSTKSRAEYVAKLRATCGIDAREDEVLSSAYAAALYCRGAGLTKKVYVLGQAGLVAELEAVGLTVLGPDDFDKPFAFGACNPAHLDPDVQAVVAGFDGRASYFKLATAVSYLRYAPGCKFVATNRDATYPDAHQLVPGGGIIVGALAIGAGREPDVVAGKPSLGLLDVIAGLPGGLDAAATCMVGDRLDTDMAFGNAGRLAASLLVLTGVTERAAAAALPPGHAARPTHVIDSLGSLAALLERAAEGV